MNAGEILNDTQMIEENKIKWRKTTILVRISLVGKGIVAVLTAAARGILA